MDINISYNKINSYIKKLNFFVHFIPLLLIIIIPLLTKELIIPYLLHPFRFGGIPFKKPSAIKYGILYLLIIVFIICALDSLSNSLTTMKECNEVNMWKSIKATKWMAISISFGLILLFLVPFLKAPLLALFFAVPYSNQIVTGIMLLPFALFGYFIGKRTVKKNVCNHLITQNKKE